MQDWLLTDTLRLAGLVAAVVLIWCVTGYLRLRGILRPGDARKINHGAAFIGGSLCFGWLAPEKARLSGLLAGLNLLALVFLICSLPDRKPFSWAFAGNTRPGDAPHEGFYFWSSWLLSMLALAGIEYVLWDPAITRSAAIVVGVGDGIAEPIGTRFGKHIYKIPGFGKARQRVRSIEGSAAVALGTFVSIIGLMSFTVNFDLLRSLTTAATVALGTAVVEAVTPHGLDNFTIAVTVAGLFVSLNYLL